MVIAILTKRCGSTGASLKSHGQNDKWWTLDRFLWSSLDFTIIIEKVARTCGCALIEESQIPNGLNFFLILILLACPPLGRTPWHYLSGYRGRDAGVPTAKLFAMKSREPSKGLNAVVESSWARPGWQSWSNSSESKENGGGPQDLECRQLQPCYEKDWGATQRITAAGEHRPST